MSVKTRYLRYRDFTRLRYGDNMLDFLMAQATRLAPTGDPVVFTIADGALGQLTITAHTFQSGDIVQASAATTLPAGLEADTNYWLHNIDANTVSIHGSLVDSRSGVNPIDLVDAGTGALSVARSADSFRIFEILASGETADSIRAAESIDDL